MEVGAGEGCGRRLRAEPVEHRPALARTTNVKIGSGHNWKTVSSVKTSLN